MATNKVPFHIKHFLKPPTTELSHFLVDNNQLTICNGINPSYKKGVLTKDLGYSRVQGILESGNAITGLHNFRQSPTIQKMLATVNNAADTAMQLFYRDTGAWTEIVAAEAAWAGFEDARVEMEDFIGHCFFVGYDTTDDAFLPVASLTGTTFSTATNVTSMPQGKYIVRYRDRLYVANTYYSGTAYPYRVYFSSVPAAGAITWTPASDFFDVDFSEQITGISQNWDRLVIFTEFSTYFYNQDQKSKTWDIGCINHRTIQNYEGYMFWADKDNVWASTGGRPQAAANDILELLKSSDPTKWSATIVDREYNLYLGTTQANGLQYTNCLATYNIETGMWRWRELAHDMSVLAKYTTSSDDYLYMGSTAGDVSVKSKYTDAAPVTSDQGSPIVSHFRTKAYDFDDPSIQKAVTKVVAYSEIANGLQLQYRLFDKNQEALDEFRPIGQLKNVVNIFDSMISGYFIQFEGREMSTSVPWKFYGLSVQVNKETGL